MGELTNPRWELFAQAIVLGLTAEAAYVQAGYQPDRGNAAKLSKHHAIVGRVAEMRGEDTPALPPPAPGEVTVTAITARLLAIAAKCEAGEQAAMLAVARGALMDAAKLNGLVIEKGELQADTVVRHLRDRPLTEAEWESEYGGDHDLGAAAGAAGGAH